MDAGRGGQAARSRALNVWRRLGYRIAPGESFSYVLHLRPAEWPIMAAHTALGTLLAVGLRAGAIAETAGEALFGLALWVICLNGGTLALNSAYDRDTGDIGYLEAPPPPPRHLAAFALALIAAGQACAFLLPPLFALDYAACFVLSVLYSVPPLRLKAVAGADWLINMWGFGTLTPLAGWALTGRPLEPWALLVMLAFCPLFAALYPLTQLYQYEEDRRRGDRTLALVLGMRRSLRVALLATLAAFALFFLAAALGAAGWRWLLLALPLAAWLAVLVPWLRNHATMQPAQHQRGMYAALRAWAVTDLAVLIVFAL
ncbi:MAG TPA: UbiA family prenyltransferase [Longimicrobiales bacterium]